MKQTAHIAQFYSSSTHQGNGGNPPRSLTVLFRNTTDINGELYQWLEFRPGATGKLSVECIRHFVREFEATFGPDPERTEAPKQVDQVPVKTMNPKASQAYKGNGKHKWEKVVDCTYRLRVPGGWLYETTDEAGGCPSAVFVPSPVHGI
jgi:hypothetical protein